MRQKGRVIKDNYGSVRCDGEDGDMAFVRKKGGREETFLQCMGRLFRTFHDEFRRLRPNVSKPCIGKYQ